MKRIGLLIVATVIFASACGGASTVGTTNPPDEAEGELGRLAAARQLWNQAAPVDYTVTRIDRTGADSTEPHIVAVRDGEVVSLDGESATVDEAFGAIEESIRQGAAVDIDYDAEYGYPARMDIDYDRDGLADLQLEYGDLVAMPIVGSLAELHAAQRRWEAQRLDSYRYLFRFDCTCPEAGTFQVDVEEGRVIDVVALDAAARRSNLDPGFNIDSAFRDLEEWFIDSADLIQEGILDVDVRTDPRYGYPRWFRIEAEDMDSEFFEGRFIMVVTIDLVAERAPAAPEIDLDDLERVEAAAARWEEAALTDYRYVLTIHCMCPAEITGPFEITIADSRVDSVKWFGDGEETDAEVLTVEEALEMIGLAVVAGTDVDVDYDSLFGYPIQVIIDPEAVAVDGGLAFGITDFEVFG